MASAWVKSLQCKSRAIEDVYIPNPKISIPKASCRKSIQNLKDVVETKKPKKPNSSREKPISNRSKSTKTEPAASAGGGVSRRHIRPKDVIFPALSELPEGHHSRNVVEIIFHTSWSPKSFTGRVEMIFKVQNASKTVSRFEEYRETVKKSAANARCVADGNELMRFHCLGPMSDYDGACGGAWSFSGSAVCTFAGSGPAHENAGGGRGRRAMMVCRVIAGRVSKQGKPCSEGMVGLDSVSGENGELFVFDSRAVLPCFLIIYKL